MQNAKYQRQAAKRRQERRHRRAPFGALERAALAAYAGKRFAYRRPGDKQNAHIARCLRRYAGRFTGERARRIRAAAFLSMAAPILVEGIKSLREHTALSRIIIPNRSQPEPVTVPKRVPNWKREPWQV